MRFRYGGDGRDAFRDVAGGLSCACCCAENAGFAIASPDAAMALASPVGFCVGRFHLPVCFLLFFSFSLSLLSLGGDIDPVFPLGDAV